MIGCVDFTSEGPDTKYARARTFCYPRLRRIDEGSMKLLGKLVAGIVEGEWQGLVRLQT